jgi:tetratricopeptide (TPR) repeat protein
MDEVGRELLSLLDGLPLALAQAASYICVSGCGTAGYLRLYKQKWEELMSSESSPLMDYEQRNVATTWMISFREIEARSKNAANLLCLWAFFDNKNLWHGLLQAAANTGERWPEWLREIACNEVRFLDAAKLLLRYSMIETLDSMQGSYIIHPVMHTWTSHIQDSPERREFLRLAVMVVGSLVPINTSKDYWAVQQRLLPHAERCSWWMGNICGANWSFDDTMAINAIHDLGNLYVDQGRPKEAEMMYQWALEGNEKALGLNHISTLTTVRNLGVVYMDQERLEEAEAMYERALQGMEKALGAEHTLTLETANNLGLTYTSLGKLDEAERMYGQALLGHEETFGAKHTSTLRIVNNLGILYKNQGRFAEAEQMYRRALPGFEEALGAEHIFTLQTVNNLGSLYKEQGKLDKAEQMVQQALRGKEMALGAKHISTLNTIYHLGTIYEEQGRLGEAKQMFQRTLQGYEKIFGPDHLKCRALRNVLCSLKSVTESEALRRVEQLVNNPEGEKSRLGTKRGFLRSKGDKVLRKLGLR